jgi:four helix bundle protein
MPFDLLTLALSLPALMRKPIEKIARRDPDLARQMRKATTSVPLCVAEGRRRAGGDRAHLWNVAHGSASEVAAGLECAVGLGYLERPETAEPLAVIDRVCAMSWRAAGR